MSSKPFFIFANTHHKTKYLQALEEKEHETLVLWQFQNQIVQKSLNFSQNVPKFTHEKNMSHFSVPFSLFDMRHPVLRLLTEMHL